MFVIRRNLGIIRMFSSGKSGIESVMKNKEKADEDIYISRMEKEAMKVLWTKIDKKIPEDTPAWHCPVTVPGGPAVPSKKTGVFLHLLAFQEEF